MPSSHKRAVAKKASDSLFNLLLKHRLHHGQFHFINLFTCLGGGLPLDNVEYPSKLLSTHDSNSMIRPGKTRIEADGRDHTSRNFLRRNLPHHDCDGKHLTVAHGVNHFCAVFNDAALFVFCPSHKSGDILEEQDRHILSFTQLNKLGALIGRFEDSTPWFEITPTRKPWRLAQPVINVFPYSGLNSCSTEPSRILASTSLVSNGTHQMKSQREAHPDCSGATLGLCGSRPRCRI